MMNMNGSDGMLAVCETACRKMAEVRAICPEVEQWSNDPDVLDVGHRAFRALAEGATVPEVVRALPELFRAARATGRACRALGAEEMYG